jgi:hypothetical protein
MLAAVIPALAWLLLPPHGPNADMAGRIAEEVAANHLHLKPLEIETGSISDIRDYFTQLDFRPVESEMMILDALELVGGRYCSVQGVTATQLRLRDAEESTSRTLYQVPYEPDRFGPLPQIEAGQYPLMLTARGLDVAVWVEKGILFALVSEP